MNKYMLFFQILESYPITAELTGGVFIDHY